MSSHADFERSPVAPAERRGFWSMFAIMMGFTFFSASMWVGQKLGSGLSFGRFVATVIVANLILSGYCGLLAYLAAKTGLSVHLLSRRVFGRFGSFIPSAILAFTQIGWFGVGVAMFVIPTILFLKSVGIVPEAESMRWTVMLTLVAGGLMTSSAYWGIKALHVVSIIAVPSIAVLGGWSALRAMFFDGNGEGWRLLVEHVPGRATDGSSLAIGMVSAVSMGIGSFISGGTCTPDFARFARTGRHAVVATVLAFFIGNSLMFFFGAAAAMICGKNDISEVLAMQGLLLPAIFVLGLNIWTTNDNALYTSGLGLANVTGLPKRHLVLVNGLVGTAASLWLYDNFCGWLNLLNTVIPPCGAILIADYFFVRHRRVSDYASPAVAAVSLAAVIAWAAGSLVALAGSGCLPFVCFFTWGIPAVNGMLVGAAVYLVIQLSAGIASVGVRC